MCLGTYLGCNFYLTAVFFNWCNASPNQIATSNCLLSRGSVSLILNPFLRFFFTSAFLKVIHAPNTSKRGVNQVPQKSISPIAFFKSLQSGLPMNLINTPMPRVSCRNDENPEKKNFEKKKFEKKIKKKFFFQKFFSQDFLPVNN